MSMKVSTGSEVKKSAYYGSGYVVNAEMPDFAVGRICTLIESFGLRESQERAAKDILRQEVWSWFSRTNSLYISPNLNNAIRDIDEAITRAERESPLEKNGPPAVHEGWEFSIEAERK